MQIAIVVLVHDRVANSDMNPQFMTDNATAIRWFQKMVNLPSDSMLFHSPGDFELVQIGLSSRNEDNQVSIFGLNRSVLVTGTASVNQSMRDEYVRMSGVAAAPTGGKTQ